MKEEITLNDLLKHLNEGKSLLRGNQYNLLMHNISKETRKLTFEINTKYHDEEEIIELMKKITGQKIDNEFSLFPPIYIDFGKKIKNWKTCFY